MLVELQKQGWKVNHSVEGVITIYACFEHGYWSYVHIYSNPAFRKYYESNKGKTIFSDGGVTDEAYVITSVAQHRLTDAYDNIKGMTESLDDAVRIAYDACQYYFNWFAGGFCDGWQTEGTDGPWPNG